jgi:hypothetical protein
VLGRLGNATHPSEESGQGGPHKKNKLYGDVWSARGERRWGWCPVVVVGGSRCEEVILDGAVLKVWSNRPKRGWSRLPVVMQVEQGGAAVRDRRGCQG